MAPLLRSFRLRLSAAFLLWTGLVQFAVTLLIPAVREVYVMRDADDRLSIIGAELRSYLEWLNIQPQNHVSAAEDRLEGSGEVDQIFIQVRDSEGRLVDSSDRLAGESLLPDLSHTPFTPGNATITFPPDSGVRCTLPVRTHRVRVTSVPVRAPDGATLEMSLGLSLASRDAQRDALSRVLTLALLVGVAGAGIVGWFVSGMVTRRIERVSKAIREVSPTRLDTRIDLPAGRDEIGQMTADVNQMLRRLEDAFRSQERFMTEVSHELKTPLAALLTEAQVLKYAHADGDRHHRFVLSVEEEMRRLSKVVESFLMLARFGHGRQFYAESIVSLNDVALDAAEHAGLLARQSGVQVTLQLHDPGPAGIDPLIRGDMELMRIVADNLLRNAIQFSKRGGRVTIRVTCDDRSVLLQVRDQGPGVPEEYLDRIFDRFAQAPGTPGVRQGTGLGLAIARGIIDLHRGTIAAENHAEGGCLFTVRLDRVSASDTTLCEPPTATEPEPPASRPATIS